MPTNQPIIKFTMYNTYKIKKFTNNNDLRQKLKVHRFMALSRKATTLEQQKLNTKKAKNKLNKKSIKTMKKRTFKNKNHTKTTAVKHTNNKKPSFTPIPLSELFPTPKPHRTIKLNHHFKLNNDSDNASTTKNSSYSSNTRHATRTTSNAPIPNTTWSNIVKKSTSNTKYYTNSANCKTSKKFKSYTKNNNCARTANNNDHEHNMFTPIIQSSPQTKRRSTRKARNGSPKPNIMNDNSSKAVIDLPSTHKQQNTTSKTIDPPINSPNTTPAIRNLSDIDTESIATNPNETDVWFNDAPQCSDSDIIAIGLIPQSPNPKTLPQKNNGIISCKISIADAFSHRNAYVDNISTDSHTHAINAHKSVPTDKQPSQANCNQCILTPNPTQHHTYINTDTPNQATQKIPRSDDKNRASDTKSTKFVNPPQTIKHVPSQKTSTNKVSDGDETPTDDAPTNHSQSTTTIDSTKTDTIYADNNDNLPSTDTPT